MADHWWPAPGGRPPVPARLLRGLAVAVLLDVVLVVGFLLAWKLAHG